VGETVYDYKLEIRSNHRLVTGMVFFAPGKSLNQESTINMKNEG